MKRTFIFLLLVALFMPWAVNAQTLTVCDGTDNSKYVPFDGYNADAAQHNQMIFPATDLSAMNGKEITQMVFYIDQSASNGSNTAASRLGTWTVSLGETTATTLSGLDNTTPLTQVYQGYFDCSTGTLTLAFSSYYIYHGGNLLVDLNHAAASWNTWYFLGVNQTENTAITRGSLYKFLPKTTFSYQTPPTCPTPGLADAQNITDSQASFSWTENGSATNWVLQYSTSEEFTNATSVNVQDTPAKAINDFQPLTTYYVRVKADCGEGDQSQWSNVISFSTTAVAQNVGDAWSDDFEGTSCGWELINGDITNAWAWGTATNNGGTHALYVSNDGGTTNAYTNTSAAMVYATKLLTFADGKYEFSYDWNGNGESSWDYMRVALVPASVTLTAGTSTPSVPSGSFYNNLPTGWIAVDGGSKLNLATAWQSKSATVNVTAGNYYMVLAWRNDGGGGTNPPAAVDNVSITKIACDQDVTNLTVSDITTNSAILSWEGGEATQWQVAYGTASNFEGATEEIVDDNAYDMTGLNSSTTYYVRVRAYCGGEDFGSWTELPSFNTACEAFDLESDDFTENFDDMTAPSIYTPTEHTMPVCWNVINTCTYSSYMYYPTVSSNGSNSTSGSNYLRFYSYYSSWSDYDPQDQYAILPVMENLDGKQIRLSVKGSTANSTFYVGLMTNPADPTTFVAFATQAPTTSYVEYEFPISGTGNYIAIKMDAATSSQTSHGLYIDDIIVEDAPTCLKPTDLVVTGTTATTATLSWTNGAPTQTAWQICLNGDEANPIMANSNPFTVEGLTAATSYTAKVRAYCGEDDQSDWSNEVSFATACEAITIDETHTYTQGFEGYTGVSYSATNGVMPVCWDSYSTGSVAPHIIGSGTGSYVYLHEGTNALTFYGSGYCYAAMPEFTNALSELEIKFWMQTESASNGELTLGYITAEDEDYSTFTAIETYANNNNSMVQRTTDLNEVPATATRLVFRWYYSTNWSCCIDDVEVKLIPTCTAPTALEVTATTTHEATLSWTAGANETAWQICLNGDETNLIEANSNPFTVENLTAATAYTAKVRAYCGEEDQSDWSNEVSFATKCEAIVVDAANPFTEDFEGDWTPLCWESIPYIDGSTTRQWTKTTTVHNGAGAAYSGYYGPIYLVMPDLQLGTDGNAAQLTFWSYNNYVNDYDKNSIVLLDGENEVELWSPESVVNSWEETTIDLTAYMGQTISLAFKYEGNNAHGWYVDDVEVTMTKTFTKTIEAVGEENWANGKGGYYLIASPVAENIMPSEDNGFIVGDYDLYYFSQTGDGEGNEWINFNDETLGGFDIVNGKGYLYASKEGTTLTFTGAPSTDGTVALDTYQDGAHWAGWNLIGNPLADEAYIDRPFYTMDRETGVLVPNTESGKTSIEAKEGVFVIADETETTIEFSTEAPAKSGSLALNLTQGRAFVDRAIVRFDEGRELPKFQLNENNTKVFFKQDNKDYAVVKAEGMGDMPVSFKAEKNGSFTMNVTSDEVSFSYLHLIDNMTGADVDLLANPTYSFNASTTDYESRFRLVFATGSSVADDNFAFINGAGNLSIFGIEGTATLQVMDVNGRVLSTETFSGSYEKNLNVAAGIYMLRLINGDNVKVQKVVVR